MTIKDLARETGYSVGTISRVLNNHPSVSEKARREIQQAIDRSGFARNENARILKQRHREGILVLVKGRKNELFALILEQLQEIFSQTTYTLIIDYFDEGENEVRKAIRLCAEKKPQGLIFLGGDRANFVADFGHITIPCVLATGNAAGLPFPNLSSVTTDDVAAADSAVSYLIAQGHREIGVIGGDPNVSDTSHQRYAGCLRAMERSGVAGPVAREQGLYSYEDGYLCMQRMLRAGKRPTAVFAMSDVQAIGAIRALCEAGLHVPQDVSVCGFDGLNISRYILPRLTTICQSTEDLAARSAALLMEQIESHRAARCETVPYRLLCCESVAPPRRSAAETHHYSIKNREQSL